MVQGRGVLHGFPCENRQNLCVCVFLFFVGDVGGVGVKENGILFFFFGSGALTLDTRHYCKK